MPGAIGIRCAYTSGTKAESPSRAKSACEQSQQNLPYSITSSARASSVGGL